MRIALVKNASSREQLEAYLPDNYRIIDQHDDVFIIGGDDIAGWTLDGYVIPRLASGLIWAFELTDDEDDVLYVRNVGFTKRYGTLLKITALSQDEVMVVVDKEVPATINRIPVQFRYRAKLTVIDNDIKVRPDLFGHRTDKSYGLDSMTQGQRNTVYDDMRQLVLKVPARILLAGQNVAIEQQIERVQREIDSRKKEIADLEAEKRALTIHYEAGVLS